MRFGEKVVIAVDLAMITAEQVRSLGHVEFLNHAEVHFVHVYQTSTYGYGSILGQYSLVYPVESERNIIEQSALVSLAKFSHKTLPSVSEGKIIYRCLFSDKPKLKLTEYAVEIKADSILVMTRERHGFFDSSFAQYVSRNSKCNVIILKTT
ncbi:MAG TPA: universal stress protein [Bacteriovoracaceae bacterium]|nr:universal stress protein [Bacteriovoracaceae bacterium]